MNFLSGKLLFHFDNFKEPAPTRYVFSTEKRMLILGEVIFDGKTYQLKDDELAELETGILPIGADSQGIVVSELFQAGPSPASSLSGSLTQAMKKPTSSVTWRGPYSMSSNCHGTSARVSAPTRLRH